MLIATGKSLRERRNQKLQDLSLSIKSLCNISKNNLSQNGKPKRKESISSVGTPGFEFKNPLQDFEVDSPGNAFQQVFQYQEKLGEGAHGVVRKCIHRKKDKQFAVKVLKLDSEHYQGLKNNFLHFRNLHNQHIIKHRALYLNPKQRICHLVMEYFPYPCIKPLMSQDILRKIFHKVFDALAYLHSKHICHRDIKPDNILYDSKHCAIRIIDLGISKNLKLRGRYEQMLTNTGTQYYKAPEMFLGGGYNEKIDSWAAGITLYQLIAGVTPFESEYHSDTIENILTKQVNLQYQNLIRCSPLLKNLLIRLLKKNPKERLSCSEAREHIWFVPPVHSINFLKSEYFNTPCARSQQNLDMHEMLKRRCSVNQIDVGEVTKSQKQNIKRWLSMVSQNDDNQHDSGQQFRYDMIDGQSDQQTQKINKKISAPSSIQDITIDQHQSLTFTA